MNHEAPILIRRAIPEDAKQLVELAEKGIPGYPFESIYDQEAVRGSIIEPHDYRVVATDASGTIFGTAVLGDSSEYMQEIKRVVVKPESRGMGIARDLTIHLTKVAYDQHIVPWLDARGDQPAMQKAALSAGFQALSLEKGKHCVYFHLDREGNNEVGSGRETMVHITSLRADFDELRRDMAQWPLHLREILAHNMKQSFLIPEKDSELVRDYLPSAREVKQMINKRMEEHQKKPVDYQSDVGFIGEDGLKMLVIKTDASGFIIDPIKPNSGKTLLGLVELGHSLGLQTITTYVDTAHIELVEILQEAQMEPTMIRLHQDSRTSPITWQVGWRSTANDFEKCLHYIILHPEVIGQVNQTISKLP